MRCGEGNVAFWTARGELLLVEAINGAAGNELHWYAGFGREFPGDGFSDQIAPAAAPNTDYELILGLRGHRNGKHKERKQKTFHVQFLRSQLARCRAAALRRRVSLHQWPRLDNRTCLSYISTIDRDQLATEMSDGKAGGASRGISSTFFYPRHPQATRVWRCNCCALRLAGRDPNAHRAEAATFAEEASCPFALLLSREDVQW